jgi:hypothetical protein
MPYSAEISRTNPACILILIDQSKSMDEPFAGQPDKLKSEGVADAVNRLIQNMVLKCAKIDGVRDYFHVGIIGYGGKLTTGLGGKLPDEVLVPIGALADKPLRVENRSRLVEDGSGGTIEQNIKFPVWYDPVATGRTLMHAAFEAAELIVSSFILSYPESYPPIILNITDGKPSDANPLPVATRLKQLASADGPVMIFNLLLSTEPKPPIYFIDDESLLLDTYSKLLFRMSTALPTKLLEAARADGFVVNPGARGVVFNADLVAVVRFLDIGTRVTTKLR